MADKQNEVQETPKYRKIEDVVAEYGEKHIYEMNLEFGTVEMAKKLNISEYDALMYVFEIYLSEEDKETWKKLNKALDESKEKNIRFFVEHKEEDAKWFKKNKEAKELENEQKRAANSVSKFYGKHVRKTNSKMFKEQDEYRKLHHTGEDYDISSKLDGQ